MGMPVGRGRVGRWAGRGFVVGWGRQSGGVALLNHRLQAGTLSGCDLDWCGFRRCRSWTRLTAGYRPSSLRDEEAGGERELEIVNSKRGRVGRGSFGPRISRMGTNGDASWEGVFGPRISRIGTNGDASWEGGFWTTNFTEGRGWAGRGFVVGWGWQSGGVALLNHRLQAGTLSGCDSDWCGFRRCRSWTRLTAGYRPSSLRDEEAGGEIGNSE
jgi:hypothetical protein